MLRYTCLPFLACLLFTTPTELRADDDTRSRPNILVILADNWAWPHASCAGDRVVQTPRFDRLAKEGLLCKQAYCQVPSCSPARAVLLTGQACHRLREAASLWSSWPHSLRTYPELLEDAGYTVGYEGKGWGPGVIFQKSGATRNRNPAGRKFPSFKRFLDAKPEGRPFCYWVGSQNPHQPWRADAKYYAGLKVENLRIPGGLPSTPETRQTMLNYYAEVQAFDAEVGDALDELERRELTKNTLVIALGDNGWQIPRGLANVYDAGTHVPLAIRWPGHILPGRKTEAFISFEDLAPTFLEVAGLPIEKRMTGRSLLPILLGQEDDEERRDAVFLERERHANVRANDGSYPCRAIRTRDFLYVRNLMPDRWPAGDPEQYFAVGPYGDVDNTPFKTAVLSEDNQGILDQFVMDLNFGKRPAEELYDLRKDRDQVNDVAADPKYAKDLQRLRKRVDEWMRKTDDPRAKSPQTTIFDEYGYFGGRPNPDRIAPAKAYRPEL